jgi:hypothetical protein
LPAVWTVRCWLDAVVDTPSLKHALMTIGFASLNRLTL